MSKANDATVAVTLAEIARIAGVGRAAVSNWRRRHESFPSPIGGSDASPLFSLASVENWLRENRKVKSPTAMLQRLWPKFDALGDRDSMGRVIATLGSALSDDGEVLRSPAELNPPERSLLDEALTLASNEGGKETFDFLLERWLNTHIRQVLTTPASLGALMAEIAEICHGGDVHAVADPACGTGSLLLEAARRWAKPGPLRLLGQDSDEVLAALAASRLRLADDVVNQGCSVEIIARDSLRADAHAGIEADVVLCSPPTNQRDWGHAELTTDSRWTFGIPPRSESELAWVQHVVSALAPDGVAVLLLPPAVAVRRAGRRIRAALLRSGALRAVIALPAGAAPPHGIGLHLWVLKSPMAQSAAAELLLIDTADCRATTSTGRPEVDWAAVRERVTAALRDEPTHGSAAVPVIDLLDEQVDLTPARHTSSSETIATTISLRREWTRFDLSLSVLADLRQALSTLGPSAEIDPAPSVALSELQRAGALRIRTGRPLPEDKLQRGDRPPDAVPVLTVSDLLLDGDPQYWITAEEAEARDRAGELTVTTSHDVVLSSVTRAFDAWVDTRAPLVLGPHLLAIRTDPTLIDPWYLAGCLRAPANARRAGGHASSSSRVDVKRLQVLQISLDEQRRYGDVFRKLMTLERTLRELGDSGGAVGRMLGELLAAGRVTLD